MGRKILRIDGSREYGHYSMDGLRGFETRCVGRRDTGFRLVVRWPGQIEAGRVCGEVICLSDFMATAAAINGASLSEDMGEDSYNILPALLDETVDTPIREATVHHSIRGKFAIRKGRWVLIDAPSGDDNKEPDWFVEERGYVPHDHPGELFDLERRSD